MMNTKPIPTKFKPDLRSPLLPGLRRGIVFQWLRVLILIGLDALCITLSWQFALNYGTPMVSPWTLGEGLYFLPLILAVEISVIGTHGLYKAGIHRRDYGSLLKAICLADGLLLLIAFLYKPNHYVSRSTFLLFWLLSSTLICAARFSFDTVTHRLRQRGAIRHAIALISDVEDRASNIQWIQKEDCYNLLKTLDARSLDRANREATFNALRELDVVEVLVAWNAIKNRLYVCWHFQAVGMTLRILQPQSEALPANCEFWKINQLPCVNVPIPAIIGSEYWVKRCFDFCCATILLILLSPLYIFLSILIKLDSPGPIFFRQTRVGLHNREFKVWKFRTMVANADKLQAKLELQNEMKDGVLFKMKDDPRITRVGKFLRRYSLDELPQIFNVLIGEMSLVGPRPLPVRDVEKFQEKYFIRQEVLPGITGLWQVSGRSNIDNFEDAMNLDLTYIVNWSIRLDIRIMLKTVQVVLCKTGAY